MINATATATETYIQNAVDVYADLTTDEIGQKWAFLMEIGKPAEANIAATAFLVRMNFGK